MGSGGQFDADGPPDLRHTSVDVAEIGGARANNWNGLVCAGVKIALGKGLMVHQLRQQSGANIVDGVRTQNGFHQVPGTRVSVQYVQADRAWQVALGLAKAMRLKVRVVFRWRDVVGAARPGDEGILDWPPGA